MYLKGEADRKEALGIASPDLLRSIALDGGAVSAIVRGFLSVDIEGLPPELAEQIQHATDLSQQEVM